MDETGYEEQIREQFKAQNQQLADLAALIDADGEPQQLPQIIAQKWPAIFDAISNSVSLLDPTATILWCNKATADLLSEPQSKIIGSKCWEMMHETSEPIENCPILRTRKTLEREATTIQKKDRWFETIIYPLLDKKSRISGFVHILTDVTEQKQADKLLKQQKEALEQKNIALKEMIEQINMERNKIEESIAINIGEALLPILEEIKGQGIPQAYFDLIKHELNKLTSPFTRKIRTKSGKLTVRETELCHLIESGLSSKEIGVLVNISKQTVEKHRKNIRKKLGITNKSISLNAYLHEL